MGGPVVLANGGTPAFQEQGAQGGTGCGGSQCPTPLRTPVRPLPSISPVPLVFPSRPVIPVRENNVCSADC